jgi:hypothetical protein
MLSGKENVLAAFDLNGQLHWKLYYDTSTGAASPIATSEKEGNFSQEDSRARLEQVLNMLCAGNYRIDFKNSLIQPKSFNSVKFNISQTAAGANYSPAIGSLHQGPPSSEYIHKNDVATMVQEMIEKDALKRRVAELEDIVANTSGNDISSAIGGVINKYPDLAALLAQRFLGGKPQIGIAGGQIPEQQNYVAPQPPATEESTTEEEPADELDSRMQQCILKLVQMEGSNENAVVLLEKLLAWIAKNPAMYNSLKPTILATEI